MNRALAVLLREREREAVINVLTMMTLALQIIQPATSVVSRSTPVSTSICCLNLSYVHTVEAEPLYNRQYALTCTYYSYVKLTYTALMDTPYNGQPLFNGNCIYSNYV